MMSKERELLKQVVENFAYVQDIHLIVAIQKLLAQPEQEHKTCSLSFLKGYARGFDVAREDYKQCHGIGGE